MSLYGEIPVNEVPAYSKAEVALYLNIPKSMVSAWTRGTTYRDRDGGKSFFYPVIVPADPQYLSFQNFIELYVLKSMRKVHEVPMKRVRHAIKALRDRSGSEHPLAEYQLLTDRRDIIIEEFGDLLNLNRYGQHEMGDLLESALKQVGYEDGEWKYRPTNSVELSPSKQFGRPCIVGTRIPTDLVYARNVAGESVDELAFDLDCETRLISDAINFESELRAA